MRKNETVRLPEAKYLIRDDGDVQILQIDNRYDVGALGAEVHGIFALQDGLREEAPKCGGGPASGTFSCLHIKGTVAYVEAAGGLNAKQFATVHNRAGSRLMFGEVIGTNQYGEVFADTANFQAALR